MTSEELEVSLRAEFENYLNDTLASVRQDVSEFQKNFEAEFAKHRSQMDDALKVLSSRFESVNDLDKGFAESVTEHLRLARDEGAQITANAFGEAEKLRQNEQPAAAPARYDLLRDAITNISDQMTQAAILGSLVEHAADFSPRGAFFIVKNDQFMGWRSFGEGSPENEKKLQELTFPVSQDTVLSHAVTKLNTVESADGERDGDKVFLDPLEYIRPDRMYAIPLVARGRGVAVLYADYGINGVELNREALETLVRVAGLTVELRAAAQQAAALVPEAVAVAHDTAPATVVAEVRVKEEISEEYSHSAEARAYQPPAVEPVNYAEEAPSEAEVYAAPAVAEIEEESVIETVTESYQGFDTTPSVDSFSWQETAAESPEQNVEQPDAASFSYSETVPETAADTYEAALTSDFEVERQSEPEQEAAPEVTFSEEPAEIETVSYDTSSFETSQPEPAETSYEPVVETEYAPAVAAEPAVVGNGHAAETFAQPPAVQAAATVGRSRFGDRTIDLPIDVPEEDRKMHNNARRFARLLVSEIKLYNEQKVVEGRESGDLYDRLREAIDRSREMYEKRVEPSVASKFDYFHYEILNDLAIGEPTKLGSNYPGANV